MNVQEQLVQALHLQEQGRFEEAAQGFRNVLAVNPNDVAGLFSMALLLLRGFNAPLDAAKMLEHAVKVAPKYAPMWALYAETLRTLGQIEGALAKYEEALRIDPKLVTALINSGVILQQLSRHVEAQQRFNDVLALEPENPIALVNSGILLTEFLKSEQAIVLFEKLLQVAPDYDYALGLLAYEKLHICDWSGRDENIRKIVEGVRAGKRVCKTLAFMAVSDSPRDHLAAARIFAQPLFPKAPQSLWNGERYKHRKIRVAYVSPDLREHPVGHLLVGVLEHHDKSRFETIGISLGIDDKSRIRNRMLKSFDRFIDVQKMGEIQIAQLMRELEVDIAVNIAGFTAGSRTEVFAFRPAPVQVNYFGYSGTMGLDYMDYIIADAQVIPEEHRSCFSEKVVNLPNCFLPNDGSIKISDRTPTRAECGLPETGFVFCSFNHDYKINPEVFEIWMRLLSKVEGSVLWLMKLNDSAQVNLRKEAGKRGIDPNRLIFATRVPLIEDHLARYRVADIVLDTFPYNAHSTSADVLFAGTPVVTCMGETFHARVAGSLLHTLGVPELITRTLADYEAVALKLATDPAHLAEIKRKIREHGSSSPLFNTELYCRNLESAFISMFERYQKGLPADSFAVEKPHEPSGIVDASSPEAGGAEFEEMVPMATSYWPVKIQGDVTVCVQPTIQQMTSYVLLEQEDWFEDEMEFVRAYVTPEMHVLDIGANHGVYALSIARKLDSGHVWAFEPTRGPGAMLARSIELNGFSEKITWVHSALSDHAGTASMAVSMNSELNSLHGNSATQECIRLETLDGYLQANGIKHNISFVKLDAEGEEVNVLLGGREFFQSQSPLVMFELKHGSTVNQGLVEAFERLGYGIYRLLPGINVLIGYDPAVQDDVLNLFACKPDHAEKLAGRGLLVRPADEAAFSGEYPDRGENWLQEILEFPFAKLCEPEWAQHRAEIPDDYLRALSACLKARNPALPAAKRVFLTNVASSLVDGMLRNPAGVHYSVWLLKVYLLHLQGRRGFCMNFAQQILVTFQQAPTPAWPFLPPCESFFGRVPQGPVGSWIQNLLREFIECRKSFSSYFVAEPLPGLQPLLGSAGHDLEIERRFVLAAKRGGLVVQFPPTFPLLDPDCSKNSTIWHTILETGFSGRLLTSETPVHIVDVGASSHGKLTEPYAPLMQLGLARVTGFEPNVEECKRLNELYAGTKKCRYLPHFVGKGGPATFYETNWFMTGSLYKPNAPVLNAFEQLDSVVQLKAEHPMQTVNLAQLDDLGELDMIKIDVQGAELDVFKGAAEKLDEVLLIWTEVEFLPLYENQPLFAEIDQYLRQRGFMFHAFEGIATRGFKPYCGLINNRNGLRQAVWSDAIFVRDISRWEGLPTLKLKKLAAILDAVTRSYDLCFLALQIIDKREGSDLSKQYVALRSSAQGA